MAKQSQAAEKINPITGIVVSLLDRGRLEAAARQLGVVFPQDTTDEKAAVNLFSRYLKEVGGDSGKLLECEFCKGRAPERIKECPYCLEQGAKATDPNTEAKMTTAAAKVDSKTGKANLAVVDGGKGKALSVPEPSLAGKTSEDLDRAVQEVFALKTKSAMGMWELGVKIAEIHDQQLWKLRDEGGKPRYKTAESFVTAELSMSITHAWNLMDVSRKFTAKDVEKFGTSKLGLLLQAPEEARPAIQQQMERGASKKVVEQEVRKANKGKKTTTTRRGPNAGKVAAKGGKSRPAKKLLTVANVLGKQTLPMYAKASMKGPKSGWKRAKRISELPTCHMELENDVVQTFTLVEHGDGTIKLFVDTHREE